MRRDDAVLGVWKEGTDASVVEFSIKNIHFIGGSGLREDDTIHRCTAAASDWAANLKSLRGAGIYIDYGIVSRAGKSCQLSSTK